jgi:hypothetical protein
VGRGHGDGEARGAEAALRAVVIDHRLLDGVERAVGGSEPFDRAQRLAVELGQEEDAGVERAGAAGGVGQQDRAGAAVAFVAALLGAGEAAILAQPVERRAGGRGVGEIDPFAVEEKGKMHGRGPAAVLRAARRPDGGPARGASSMRRRARA